MFAIKITALNSKWKPDPAAGPVYKGTFLNALLHTDFVGRKVFALPSEDL